MSHGCGCGRYGCPECSIRGWQDWARWTAGLPRPLEVKRAVLHVMRVNGYDGPLPETATEGSAGLDLRASVDVKLYAGEQKAIPLGLAMAIPSGYFGDVRGRSGLAFKHGIWGFSGTIDSDYRGEVHALLWNTSPKTYDVKAGDRVAQLVLQPFGAQVEVVEVQELPSTIRGAGGMGSTGR